MVKFRQNMQKITSSRMILDPNFCETIIMICREKACLQRYLQERLFPILRFRVNAWLLGCGKAVKEH